MRELLLCPPDYYGIEYEINPWMSRARGAEAALAQEQWNGLHATLSKLDCKIDLVAAQPKLPTWFSRPTQGSRSVGNSFRVISGTRSARGKRRILRAGWKNTATKSRGSPSICTSKVKAMHFSEVTRFFAATNFVRIFNRIARWQTCSAAS